MQKDPGEAGQQVGDAALTLDDLACRFLKQLAHESHRVRVKALFDRLPADMNPQAADHMP